MFEQNGKRYTVKLNVFAEEHGISVRTVQKKLNSERYQLQLQGEYLRTPANGTWLTEEACTFLKSTLQKQAVGFVSDSVYERQIAELKQEKENLLIKIATQADKIAQQSDELRQADKALGEVKRLLLSAKEDKERSEALEAQNDDLRAEIKRLEELVAQERKTAEKASEDLTDERQRRISFKEFWSRRK